jgi:hypothetical protein
MAKNFCKNIVSAKRLLPRSSDVQRAVDVAININWIVNFAQQQGKKLTFSKIVQMYANNPNIAADVSAVSLFLAPPEDTSIPPRQAAPNPAGQPGAQVAPPPAAPNSETISEEVLGLCNEEVQRLLKGSPSYTKAFIEAFNALLASGIAPGRIAEIMVIMCTDGATRANYVAAAKAMLSENIKVHYITKEMMEGCANDATRTECAAAVKAMLGRNIPPTFITKAAIEACADAGTRTDCVAVVEALYACGRKGDYLTKAIIEACADARTRAKCIAAVKAMASHGVRVDQIEAVLQACSSDETKLEHVTSYAGTIYLGAGAKLTADAIMAAAERRAAGS